MNNNLTPAERIILWFSNSITLRLLFIAFLALLLLIPAGMITGLIRERESTSEQAIDEVSSTWAASQRIDGPILSIPFEYTTFSENGTGVKVSDKLYILPEILAISGNIKPEKRHRGIYEAIVYKSDILLSGTFRVPSEKELPVRPGSLLTKDAVVIIGISDLRGIQQNVSMQLKGAVVDFEPGIADDAIVTSGITGHIKNLNIDTAGLSFDFTIALDLNGSRGINFTPTGKTTTVSLASDWQDPSFNGAFLPDERSISDKGFSARWEIFHLNRNFPQLWTGRAYSISESMFGVELMQPADAYQKAYRSVRYALLIIALTFLVFFLAEIRGRFRINPLQYILVGLGLVLFYSLLLSLAEHLGFDLAYLIAGIAIVALIGLYSLSIFTSRSGAILLTSVLTLLYLFLYILLRMNDYALLIGNIALFVILGVVMYLSARMNMHRKEDDHITG